MFHRSLRVSLLLGAALISLAGCGGGGGGGGSSPPPPGPPGPAPQTIAFASAGPIAKTYGDAAFTNAASGGAGTGAISYVSSVPAVATVDGASGAVNIVAAGTTIITASKAADAANQAASASYTLTVAPLPQVITFAQAGPVAKNFGDAAFTNAASGGAGTGAIAYTSSNTAVALVNTSSGLVTIAGAGTTQITATKVADNNHLAAQASYTLNVASAGQTLSFVQAGPISKVYGDPPFVNPASGTGGSGAITYASSDAAVLTVDASGGLVTLTGAGSATITATRAADPNHTAVQASYQVNVARAMQTINFTQIQVTKTFGDPVFTNAASGGGGNGAITYSSRNAAVATVNPTSGAVTIVGAGATTIDADKAPSANHFGATTSYQLFVSKAPQNIAFALSGTVDKHTVDAPFTNAASGGAGTGAITYASDNTAVATVTSGLGSVTVVAAGQAHITASKATDANYLAAQTSYTLNVMQLGTLGQFTAWMGADDTEVKFPAIASGDEFLRADFPTCVSPLLAACGSATSTLLGTAQVTDTVSTLSLWSQYWLRRAGVSYPAVQLSRSRFPAVKNAQMVEFNDQMWMVGAPPNAATWSTYDGRSWVIRSTANAYGSRTGHRAAAFNNLLWVVGGYKTTGTPGFANDVWSSPDGVNWTQVTASAQFTARDSHGLVAYNGRLWVVGGQQSNGGGGTVYLNDVWSSADGLTWTRATQNAPFSVRSPQLVVFNNRLWVVGGAEGGAPRNDAWSSADGINWTQAGSAVILGTAPGLRAAVLGSRLYTTGAEFAAYYQQKVFYTDTGNSWTFATTSVPFGRRDFSAFFSFRNRIWLIGGDTPIEQICCTRSDVWSSANGATWTYEHTSAPYSPSQGQHLVEFANRLWLFGPGGDGFTNAWSSVDGDDWVKSPGAASLPKRQWPGITTFNGRLWMVGGLEGDSGDAANFKNDVWSSVDGNTWTRVTANAPFTGRNAHNLYTANGKMFLTGGVEGPPYVRPTDLWSTTDGVTWVRESTTVPFGPRVGLQTASFNGRVWLVGGADDINQLHADAWSSADGINWRRDVLSDPRLQRYEHRLTVFGGRMWLTGGRGTTYTETRDLISSADGITWRTEPTPAWSARTSHAAAAFGSHLFLFGGLGATLDENRENEMWRSDDGIHWRQRHNNTIAVP